jgi:hypothetical protein
MQSGVAMELGIDPSSGTPKHLRVGVNTALCDHGALVKLLVSKGIITEEEYFSEAANMMESEVKTYEQRLTRLIGTTVTLGEAGFGERE